MEKLLKKIIASFMCFSLLTLQLSFAAEMTGEVLPGVGNNPGADIESSTGGFTGFDKPSNNEANLNFNDDAVINWGHLNVGSGQILNFLNGNYAVLNNVLNGMSTFAGQITGQTGAIIISNPNGMLMTGSGASIVTNGTLILTTKDLYNIDNNSYFDAAGKLIYGKDNALDLINNASYSDKFNIISLNDGHISAGNINILAKGIDIYDANLTSTKDGGNIVLKTTDGANFIGYEVKKDENNVPISITGVKADDNNFSASINVDHNSVIKTNNGNIEIIANNSNKNNSVYVADSTLTGKTNITTNNGDLQFCGNTQQGNLTTNINGFSELYKDTVLGDVNLTSTDRIDVRDMSAYDANLLSTNGFITLSGINDFDGEFIAKTTGLDPTNSYIAIGNTLNNGSSPLEDGSFIYTTLDADNVTLIAENGNIGLAGVITADGQINITANNGSIYSAQGAISSVQNILNAKEYNLTASGDIGSLKQTDTSVEPGKGKGFNFTETVKGRKNPTFDELGSLSIAGHDDAIKGPNNSALYNELNVQSSNANIKADGNIQINGNATGKNVSNNLVAESSQAINLNGVKSGNDMTITAGGPIVGWASAGNDMSLNSDSFMYIDTMYAGNEFNAIAKGYIDLYNLSAKNANLISENDGVILTGTDNNIIENFYAKGKTYVAIGNTYNDGIALEDKIFIPTELNAKNVTLVSENGNIGLAGIINADDSINITANNGSIYSADYAIPVGKNILNAKEYNLTASGDIGSIQPTNPSVDPGKGKGYNFTEAVKGRRTPTFDELGSLSIAGHDDSIKGPNNTALYNEVNIKADNANIKADGNIKLNKAESGNNVSNNLIVESDQAISLKGVSSGNDMLVKAAGPIVGWASAGNDMSLNSDSFMYIDTMYAGNEFSAIAKGYIDLYNLSAKNANLISENDGVILTGTNNNITENFYANGKTYVAIGNTINGGSNPEDYAFEPTKLNAQNVTLVTENGNIGLAGIITADDTINITANNGSIYSAENSIPAGESILNAQKYNLTAGKNVASIEPTDANLASGSIGLDFTEAVKGQNKNPQSFGSLSINGGDVKLQVGNDVDIKAKNNLNINNSYVGNNLVAESTDGHVAVKYADVDGNTNLTAKNGVKIWFSDFAKDLTAIFTGDRSVGVPSDAMQTDPPHDVYIAYSQVHGNAELKAPNASDAQITVSNTTIDNNLDAQSAGSVVLWQANVGKHVNAKADNGSVSLSGLDKRTEVGSITADAKQNIIINNSDVKGNANLKSGLDVKSTNSNLIGDTKVEARNASFTGAEERINIIYSNVTDNLTAETKGNIHLWESTVGKLFKANSSEGEVRIGGSDNKKTTIGSADLTGNKGVTMWDTNIAGTASMTAENNNISITDSSIGSTSKLNAKNGNILSSNANYGGNITADAKNAIFDSSKAGKLNFVDSNITGNLKATADNKVVLNNSTVGGKFTGKSNNYETTVNHSTVGSAELTSKWNNSFNNSTSNGDIKMSSEGGHSTINASTIKGNAELTAKGNAAINGSTVDGNATVKATDGKASIWESIVGKKATVTSENYEAAIGASEGKTSQVGFAEITSKYNNRLYNTTVNGDAKLTSTNGHSSVSNATIKGNAELTAKGNSAINGSTVDGDATVKATDGKASIWESIVGKKATVTSENYEAAIGASEGKTSQVGSAEIKSKWNNRLYNTTVNGDAKLTSTNGNSSVSNATIKGNAELTAKVSAAVSDSNIESNATVQSETGKASIYKSSVTGIAKVTSSKNEVAIGESQVGTADMYGETGARFYNSKSNGELKIKANTGDVNITNATVRNVNATSHKANINVKNTETTGNSRNHFTAKNGNVTSTNSNYIGSIKAEVGKTADFNTDKNITFDYVSADKLNVVSNNENIGIIGNIIADKINLTATNGSIYATTNALLDGNTYNLKALNQIASLDDISDVMNKTDYDWSLQNAINIAGGTVESLSAGIASVHSNGNVTFVTPETTKGNLRLSSDGDLKINKGANVAGNLLTQADGSITTSGNIMAGFDVKAYATDDINIENVNAGRNLELKSNKGNINLGNDSKASSVSGKTTLTADKDINVKNYTSTDSFNATSNNGAITLNKASVGNRAIPAGQYKGITLNAKKDITVNNSYSHGKFIANSTQGSVSVGNTGVETQGSDITAGKDVNLNQFHSAAHVNITAGENVNAKAIGTSANQSIWTVKAGKDANFENLNLNNKNGGLKVEANNININNAPSVGIKQPNVQGQVDLNAKNDIKIENGTEFGSKLNATAGNNISLDRKGDLTINNSSPISLKAGNTVSVSTDGQLVIDNLTSNDIVNGTNVNFAGANITTNNSTYHTNVGMDSKGDVTFTGVNNINGDLTISASKDSGFVAINGDSTKANNITVNGAQYIEANNVETGHLQFNDFEIGHILNTTADSTGFNNGNDLYVNVLNTIINSGELRPSITGSAIDVDRIIFYPTFPEGGDGTNLDGLDEDSALILGYLRDKAIETKLGSDFAPIGFAAHEGRRGGLHHMDIGDSVYRALQEQIDTLHITDRFNIDQ